MDYETHEWRNICISDSLHREYSSSSPIILLVGGSAICQFFYKERDL
ncbi:14657_t:CDS:1, partial [Acaulospora morrowiae]